MIEKAQQTAALLVIGNEILSGKTAEANVQYIAQGLADLGIVLSEVRVIPDEVETIVRHVNECREQFAHVITTGGIGPTHDDVTAESVAQAFHVELELNSEAVSLLGGDPGSMSEAKLKMARFPRGAVLIDNAVSKAPGFRIGNVAVLAGVPSIARAMFDALRTVLTPGPKIHSANVDVFLRESEIAGPLEAIARRHGAVEIGSYPFMHDGRYGANIVVRGTDEALVRRVITEVSTTMDALINGAESPA
jgi:molybdenum cofactor synthesis domain-containing protein